MLKKFYKKHHYLTLQHLHNLKEHKYSSNGKSLIEPLFQKFWNWVIDYVPSNIAPNTLTIIGLAFNVISVLILGIYSPNGINQLPAWALIFCAFGLFIYQTLDALDGKQARKTNTSSQLGELFDHGCDAISSNFVVLGNILAIGMGDYPWLTFIHYFVTICLFYLAHWQVYVTGTLEFGKLDVTESQLAVMFVYFVSAIYGIDIWKTNLPILGMEFKLFHFYVMLFGGVSIFWRYFRIIQGGGCGRHGATVANTSILFPFFPIAIVVAMAITVAIKSPTQIYHQHPVLYLISFGLVACKVTHKLVVAYMTKSEICLFDYELIGPFFLILNQYWFNSYFDEYTVLWICCILTTINLLVYDRSICNQIAEYLNINIFSVYPRQPTTSTTAPPLSPKINKHKASLTSLPAQTSSSSYSNRKFISSSSSSTPTSKQQYNTRHSNKDEDVGSYSKYKDH